MVRPASALSKIGPVRKEFVTLELWYKLVKTDNLTDFLTIYSINNRQCERFELLIEKQKSFVIFQSTLGILNKMNDIAIV